MKTLDTSRWKTSISGYFPFIIYFVYFSASLYLLYIARNNQLMGMPVEGTDQLSMIQAAVKIYEGHWLPEGYKYSPIYTTFLSILVLLSKGDLIIMRILQAAVCSFIPVMIYKLTMKMDFDRETAQISSLVYLFYGPAMLISLDFLRAGPLALCSIMFVYFFICSLKEDSHIYCLVTGIFGGICILGRENFIPVVIVSSSIFIIARYKIKLLQYKKKIALYAFGVLIAVSPVSTYNLVKYGNPAILPGNFSNVMKFYHGKPSNKVDSYSLPLRAIEKVPSQAYKFISSYEMPNSLSFYAHRDIIDFLWVFIIPFNLIILLAVAGTLLYRQNYYVVTTAFFCVLYGGSMLFFEMFYRFRIPAVPVLVVLSGIGIKGLLENKSRNLRIALFFPMFAMFLLTYTAPDKLRTKEERKSVVAVLIMNGYYYKAEKSIDKLLEESVDSRMQIQLLINALNNDGQNVRAREIESKYGSMLFENSRN